MTPPGHHHVTPRHPSPPFLRGLGSALLLVGVVIACVHSCGGGTGPTRGMIVLGIDGMDHRLLQRYLGEGLLPNIRRLTDRGEFKPLSTTIPPQSPVAWSTFLTGSNPGRHGISDFIHRDPGSLAPYRSTSRVAEGGRGIALGSYVLPLASGEATLLRRGRAFWEHLAEEGIHATIVRIPASFPPPPSGAEVLSGMGTPDLLGTPGTFSFYSDRIDAVRKVDGGRFIPVEVEGGKVEAALIGPLHPLRRAHGKRERPSLEVPFTAWIDPGSRAAKIRVQDEVLLLRQGEWSDWVHLRFEVIPETWDVRGICRFYLKEAGEAFRLYVSPINLDPADPALPISSPEGFVRSLEESLGPFYTQEMAEDTKALTNGVLTDDEFLEQATFVLDEQVRQFERLLDRFSGGLLFCHFSAIDQGSHVFWRAIDPSHPLHTPEVARKYGRVIPDLYRRMDDLVGRTMDRADPSTAIVVMSDHGFTSFRRAVHLNTWLLENGYVRLLDPSRQGEGEFFGNVDWSRSRAYGFGLNGLYVNRRGREKAGIVNPGEEEERLLEEISEGLLALRDPVSGGRVIRRVFRSSEAYRGEATGSAPDLIIGYEDGYRASWETILGEFPRGIIEDNMEKWSGDHCIDPEVVPGVLITDRPIAVEDPALIDLAPGILAYFGIAPPPSMEGRPLFGK